MTTIKRTFSRKSPGALNERVPLPLGWFAIPYLLVNEKAERRLVHGKWFKITSIKNGKSIYRSMRFAGDLASHQDPCEMLLDFVGWLELTDYSENIDVSVSLEIRPVKSYEKLSCLFSTPDPGLRLVNKLAVLSMALGVISFIISLLPFIHRAR